MALIYMHLCMMYIYISIERIIYILFMAAFMKYLQMIFVYNIDSSCNCFMLFYSKIESCNCLIRNYF